MEVMLENAALRPSRYDDDDDDIDDDDDDDDVLVAAVARSVIFTIFAHISL
jgi:hypothetical protein